jgi:GNAT superfamily N-acetyltransferase
MDATTDATTTDDLRIVPATSANATDLDELFRHGDARSCQCTWMRFTNADYRHLDQAAKRAAHHEAIAAAETAGRAAGLIAYRGDRAVGWVSFDERDRFDRVVGSKLLEPADNVPAWSIVCFVVAADARRQGVANLLLDHAVAYAADHGAKLLESYPVEPGPKPSSASLWRGTVSMFERAGFTTVEVRRFNRSTPPRPIMRRPLPPADGTETGDGGY